MKNILFLLIFLGLAVTLSAQSNFKRGYIITNEKDTMAYYPHMSYGPKITALSFKLGYSF